MVVKADTELELQAKLLELSMATDAKLELITIYPRGSYVYAWYFRDIRKDGIPNMREMAEAATKGKKRGKPPGKSDTIEA
jgi:hypothetical protein